jgi:outer membrane protein insertion porin family
MIKLVAVFVIVIICQIFPQERYELVKIEFEGNNTISSSELKEIIYSEETPMFLWKWLNRISSSLGSEALYFDSTSIPIDLESLQAYYYAHGFFMPEFSYSYTLDTVKWQARLKYTIDEGPRSTYRELRTTGLGDVPDHLREEIYEELEVDSGAVYLQVELVENITSTLPILLNNGYMFARYDSSEIFKDTVNNSADILINYTTGPRLRIDTVLINLSGAAAGKIDDNLIRKITDIKAGEFYNLQKLRQSQQRLFRTDIFNSIIISGSDQDTAGGWIPLRIEGNISHMNELSPEIILNNQNNALNLGLGTNYIRKNFFGHARRLNANVSFAIQEFFNTNYLELFNRFSFRDTLLLGYLEARVTIEQPFLFNEPIFGIWTNYGRVDKQRRYNISTYGTKFTFEFELPPFTFINALSTYYNLEQTNEYYFSTPARNDSVSRKLLSIIGFDAGRSTTDDLLFPRSGYNIVLGVEEANTMPYLLAKLVGTNFGGALFYRLLLNSAYYYGLDRGLTMILATKLKAGHLQTYLGDYHGIPLNRTFYVGGSNSVRGWRSNELPGRDVKGGTFLMEGSLEYRWRFAESLGTAFFFDYGNTWVGGWPEFQFSDLALAVGLGFRFYTPVAPFRLDFGFKFFDPNDRRFLWEKQGVFKTMEFHFGIGEAF